MKNKFIIDFHHFFELCFLVSGCTKEKESKQPNIIYILADDLGYAELGCYGQQQIETPNIDKLAERGMRFTQNYAGTAVSAPSRCITLQVCIVACLYSRK